MDLSILVLNLLNFRSLLQQKFKINPMKLIRFKEIMVSLNNVHYIIICKDKTHKIRVIIIDQIILLPKIKIISSSKI